MGDYYLVMADGQRLPLSGRMTVGREPRCQIVLDDASISREHAVVEVSDGVTVTDNQSRNGTFVDGARLAPGERRRVGAGAELGFGNLRLKLEEGESDLEFDVRDLLPKQTAGDAPMSTLLADVMYRAQAALFPGQPVDTLYEALLHLSLAFVPGQFAALQLGDTRVALLRDGRRVDREITLSSGLRDKVLREKKTVLMRNRDSDAELARRASLIAGGVTSAVAAPIFDGDEIMGLLYVTVQDGTQALNEVDAAVCTALASSAGTALLAARMLEDVLRENERLRARLRALGEDPSA